jgi:PAS domain S-box-containing protein
VIGLNECKNLVVSACNNQFFQLTGGADAILQAFPIPFEALMTDSASRGLREKLLACFASAQAQKPEQTYDFREGKRWWRLSLKPIWHAGADVSVREILVTGFDMATKSNLSQQPEVSASRYRALVDLAYDAIVTMDDQHNITLFNRAAENLFGYSSAEVLGRPIVTLLPERFRANHPRKVQQFADSYDPGARKATPPRMDESNSVYGRHRDGSVIPVEIAVSRIDLNGGVEFMAVVRDITDRARLMELLKKQATTDALTGLPNRREFIAFIENMLVTDDGLSVFILDIDFSRRSTINMATTPAMRSCGYWRRSEHQ